MDLLGRIDDTCIPRGWWRSKRDNLCHRGDTHLVTIFRYPDSYQFGICTKQLSTDQAVFEPERFADEASALDHAENLIWDLEHEHGIRTRY